MPDKLFNELWKHKNVLEDHAYLDSLDWNNTHIG